MKKSPEQRRNKLEKKGEQKAREAYEAAVRAVQKTINKKRRATRREIAETDHVGCLDDADEKFGSDSDDDDEYDPVPEQLHLLDPEPKSTDDYWRPKPTGNGRWAAPAGWRYRLQRDPLAEALLPREFLRRRRGY